MVAGTIGLSGVNVELDGNSGEGVLKHMAEETGGRLFQVDRKNTLESVFDQIQQIVHDDYICIWLYDSTAAWGVLSRVKNFENTVRAPFGGFHWRAEEWDIA